MTLLDSTKYLPADSPLRGYVGIVSNEDWRKDAALEVWGAAIKPRYKIPSLSIYKEHVNDPAYCVANEKLFLKMHGEDDKTAAPVHLLVEMTSADLSTDINSEALFMLGKPASFEVTIETGADSTFSTYTDHKCGSYSDTTGD